MADNLGTKAEDVSPTIEIKEGDRRTTTEGVCGNPEGRKCPYFLEGICRFGDRCWYEHAERNEQQISMTLATNTRNSPRCSRHRIQKHETTNWADAPEFVPKTTWKSFAETLKSNIPQNEVPRAELCPDFTFSGHCPFQACPYIHGDQCELCQHPCLNPLDEVQRNAHLKLCERELERDMEISFAIQRSEDKCCGICKEIIFEKEFNTERRFGILERCNHVFCLDCIRTWRRVKSFEDSNVDSSYGPVPTRRCPECRIPSDFVIPSEFWVEGEDKQKLISDYKKALGKKPCKYFNLGKGTCPFGGLCFYLHATPDGTLVELPAPTRRRRQNATGELDIMNEIYLWNFIETRDEGFSNEINVPCSEH